MDGVDRSSAFSVVLSALASLASNCPGLAREAVVDMILFHKAIGIPLEVRNSTNNNDNKQTVTASFSLLKMLKRAVSLLSGPDRSNRVYLESMLSFVVRRFLKENKKAPSTSHAQATSENTIENFPHHLLDCSTPKKFLERYERVLVPLCLWHRPTHEECSSLAAMMGKSECRLLEGSFAHLLGYYLSHYVAEKDLLKRAHGGTEEAKR